MIEENCAHITNCIIDGVDFNEFANGNLFKHCVRVHVDKCHLRFMETDDGAIAFVDPISEVQND